MDTACFTSVTDASLVEAVVRTLGKLADSIVSDAEARPEQAELRAGSN
jgi:hypothetical protein